MHDHPVYVTGMMESGKSTFMSLLDGHPDLLVFPQEPQFGRMLERQLKSAEEARQWSLEESSFGKHGRLLGIENQQDSVFDHSKYRASLDKALDQGFAAREVMIATMRAFAEATGQKFESHKYWIFNEPNQARLAPWFFSTFPKGRVIHLLRDPREHFRAVKAHHRLANLELGRFPALHFSMDWALGAKQAAENRRKFGDDRYLVLRFEDICDNRQAAMHRVAEFLELEFDSTFLRPSKVGVSAPSSEGRISESDIGDWLRPLAPHEKLVIESCCADLMSQADHSYQTKISAVALNLIHGLLCRAVYGSYYGKRLLKGIVLPAALHELYRADKAVNNSDAFRL